MSASIFVALDFESGQDALDLVERLGPSARGYKVGLQLLVEAGPELVRDLVARGKSVFLDLKAHEIPSSVSGAVRAAGKLGATMVTVHASGGSAVLRSAVEAAAPFRDLKVLALTVITSLKDQDLPEIGLAPSVEQQVIRLSQLAVRSGCHGVVASAHEARILRRTLPKDTLIVVPGVQLPAAKPTDQSRTSSAAYAAECGATHIIAGRAVTSAQDPAGAFSSIAGAFLRQ